MSRGQRRGPPPAARGGQAPALQLQFQEAVNHHQAGRFGAAEKIYARLLDLRPNFAPALHHLGVLAAQTGRYERAVELIRQALKIEPGMPHAHNHLGVAYFEMGRYADAHECYRLALAQSPRDPVLLMNVANLLRDEERYDEADRGYREILAMAPAYADAVYNHAISLLKQQRLDEAAILLRRALELRPNHADSHHRLGVLLLKQERIEDARACFQRALQLDAAHVDSMMSLGQLAHYAGNRDEALGLLQRSVDLGPDNARAHYNLALCLLAWGELRAGFAEHEWRWRTRERRGAQRPCRQPPWDGSPLAGKSIFVWREQGVGDEIIYGSMIPDLVTSGARVVLECDARLVPLFARTFPSVEVVPQILPADPLTESTSVDYQAPVATLGLWLRHDFSSFPRDGGYLKADPRRAGALREKYRALSGGRQVVGISWHSRLSPAMSEKGTQLAEWKEILGNAGAFFVNLQYGDCAQEIETARAATGVSVYSDPEIDAMKDLDGFAAQVHAMDMVVSTSNTTVHFAGAQDVPCWTLLPAGPGALWYWFTGREDSPWYPSMRLFRRRPDATWQELLARVGKELEILLEPVGHPPSAIRDPRFQ